MKTYKQAVKDKSRTLIWQHAVESLTKKRDEARLLNSAYLAKLTGFVEQEYSKLAANMVPYYLQQFSGISSSNLIMRTLNKLTGKKWRSWVMNRKYSKGKLRTIRNCIQCEANRELILKGMQE